MTLPPCSWWCHRHGPARCRGEAGLGFAGCCRRNKKMEPLCSAPLVVSGGQGDSSREWPHRWVGVGLELGFRMRLVG